MKHIILFAFLLVLNTSCSQDNSILLKHSPNDSLKSVYATELDLGDFKIYSYISKKVNIKNDTLFFTFKNDSIVNNNDGVVEMVPVDNSEFILKTNNLGKFFYDNEEEFVDELVSINYNLHLIEFPKNKISIGDRWSGKRVVNDMVFKKLITNYVFLEELPNEKILIGIEFTFDELKDKNFKLAEKFSKKMIGEYVIDKHSGAVRNAIITVSGNSGFGETSQGMRITINKI